MDVLHKVVCRMRTEETGAAVVRLPSGALTSGLITWSRDDGNGMTRDLIGFKLVVPASDRRQAQCGGDVRMAVLQKGNCGRRPRELLILDPDSLLHSRCAHP